MNTAAAGESGTSVPSEPPSSVSSRRSSSASQSRSRRSPVRSRWSSRPSTRSRPSQCRRSTNGKGQRVIVIQHHCTLKSPCSQLNFCPSPRSFSLTSPLTSSAPPPLQDFYPSFLPLAPVRHTDEACCLQEIVEKRFLKEHLKMVKKKLLAVSTSF